MLSSHGLLAALHITSNQDIQGFAGKISAAAGVVFSWTSYRVTRQLIRDCQPDVVHVHNFFPRLSPSVFYACRAEGIPTVLTLHNYRIVCPTAMLLHEGKVTERSLTEGPWWAFRQRVYRNSWAGTFFLCLMIWFHQRAGTWKHKVDRFIVLSEFGRERMKAAGIPAELMVVKPNFVDIPRQGDYPRAGLLFVGRLSAEKGIGVLLDAVAKLRGTASITERDVTILGGGPMANVVATAEVNALGPKSGSEVRQHMTTAVALVMPSIWYEGFPMVLVEAYACGLPIIASRIGALAELVEDGVTGLLSEPGNSDDLAAKMEWALNHPDEIRRMGEAARRRYESLYTPSRNLAQLTSIYEEAIANHREGPPRGD
ncbi:glycosyltransferase family 4 protein [Ideonella alba]|uniref:Glycosyltransferase family 4 protein n=1 Tax=Ideonella alba TaxID=2824118 RepID=A0A941BCI2_9BURK|nr:glycosyltransferase family 4 protein [Ideonella alba]MBQ0929176.1 glycosyltransferase family 4 protein [Ideonella alba]